MAPKRLSKKPPSASGEEDVESEREENPVDSESESDNNASAFETMPIIPKFAARVDPEPEKSGDAAKVMGAADETRMMKKNKKMRAVKTKSPIHSQKSLDLSKKVNNAFAANTDDAADVEIGEAGDEPPFHITLALPCKKAHEKKKQKANMKGFGGKI
ncbi:hypothetical protein HS088_TW09G00829 [Tripterygium wilfordii]|uniref:Uncharacterized protein n=1 Tax=Tripterygium wilfordii TaxID=458696 RepID=A0A7J7D945_TRIWF|nr:hypothetical protein HS088_TW09G00829 [Tripterygium wilfordii]